MGRPADNGVIVLRILDVGICAEGARELAARDGVIVLREMESYACQWVASP